MRIGVISQIQPGSSRAHVINTIKTAGGFHRLGHEVSVYCLQPENHALSQPGSAYAEHDLHWRFAPADSAQEDPESFGAWAARTAQQDKVDLVYARNFWGPLFTARAGIVSIMESHAHVGVENELLDQCLQETQVNNAMRSVITIGRVLRDDFIQRGARADRVWVVADGVDFELFDTATPHDYGSAGPHIVYAGHLYDYKGVPAILESAQRLPAFQFHLVGGLEQDQQRVKDTVRKFGMSNVTVHGSVEHRQVPAWTRGADVLLLPPSNKEASKDWTSPVKLGEYLASGSPLVVSRIPALVEALGQEPVTWCEPDDGESLALGIETALATRSDHAARARRRTLAQNLSYTARAARILKSAHAEEKERAA